MVPPWSLFLTLTFTLSIAFLLTVLSIHNWKFPLLSSVGARDNAASMFCGAWLREIEHCLMQARQAWSGDLSKLNICLVFQAYNESDTVSTGVFHTTDSPPPFEKLTDNMEQDT